MEVVLSGQPLSFQVYGSGIPLIVLPGWGDDSGSWSKLAELLSVHYQVFLIDFPGTGYSPAPDAVWGINDYCKLIEDFTVEMGIRQPILLGHSHGGKIGCCLAAGGNVSPRALIIVSASGTGTKSPVVRAKIYAFKTLKFLAKRFGAAGNRVVERARGYFGSSDYRSAGPMQATLVRLVNSDIRPLLRRITAPTLILWGDKDQTLPVSQAKNFRDRIAGSFIRILWDSGHFPQLDEPDAMAAIVTEFLAQLGGESTVHAREVNGGF